MAMLAILAACHKYFACGNKVLFCSVYMMPMLYRLTPVNRSKSKFSAQQQDNVLTAEYLTVYSTIQSRTQFRRNRRFSAKIACIGHTSSVQAWATKTNISFVNVALIRTTLVYTICPQAYIALHISLYLSKTWFTLGCFDRSAASSTSTIGRYVQNGQQQY